MSYVLNITQNAGDPGATPSSVTIEEFFALLGVTVDITTTLEGLGFDSSNVSITWKGEDSSGDNDAGDSNISGGAASGGGQGGGVRATGGDSVNGNGGVANLTAGSGGNNGGTVRITAGAGGLNGGQVIIASGHGSGGDNGDISVNAAGYLYLNLPTADPEVAGALWADNGIVTVSAG